MSGSGRSGTGNRAYRRNVQIMLAANDVCGICGHGGSLTGDHIIPYKAWPKDERGRPLPGFNALSNLQPGYQPGGTVHLLSASLDFVL